MQSQSARHSVDSLVERDLAGTGTHVVLGTGQVGHAVAQQLRGANADVRLVSRSGRAPDDLRDDVTTVSADIADPAAARAACEGGAVVYCCVQPPYERWAERFPPLLDGALEAAEHADARFVMADNLYMYGPVDGPIHEGLPETATTEKGRTRAEMARTIREAHESGRVEATVGRASDFYGPGVTGSIVGPYVFEPILDGGTVWFPGDPDLPHTYTYVPDFARALVTLGSEEAALGEVWHVPNAETVTTREFVQLAGRVAGTDPTVRGLPSWVVRPLGLVSGTMRELAETQYQRSEPYVVSHERFAETFDFTPTPHREALEATVAWYRARD